MCVYLTSHMQHTALPCIVLRLSGGFIHTGERSLTLAILPLGTFVYVGKHFWL